MRKAVVISMLSLAVAGCAAPEAPPQVSDLSTSREQAPRQTVTVEAGDTLYGIAWRNNMDFRELARLNGITPPYRIQPGQTLRLSESADAGASSGTGAAPAVARPDDGAGGAGGAASPQNPDWLLAGTGGEASGTAAAGSQDDGSPERRALATAAGVGNRSGAMQAPGPVYEHAGSSKTGTADKASTAASAARDTGSAETSKAAATGSASSSARKKTDTAVSSRGGDTGQGAKVSSANKAKADSGQQADAGTAVAGGAEAPKPAQRSYQPVTNISWQWPTEGKIVGRFSDNSNITAGIDIAGQKGQPVKAAGPGIVVYAGSGVRGYGNLILLKHNDHFLSAYAHNDSLRVKENDVVKAGEVIATMGNSDADGVKLHFEVRKDGQPRDPLDYLPAR
ncbi:peptidoglycan DD-metalloendopeptidase family protein [Modicisalibacter tunisiensis]|uniref:Peptidoglycan DD-metalloendopeptidase family protein n=1 Tax=Modicisalibacter tunisiensis TaxID=390637 RepID=A0ABS7WU74_9GAMM|nr:peptidoglycan DD-metalloendopeptidase family protein [Modicisalibacter tunisiensis]MBZ9566161.1 peptidoglycan DD-metalloendopeptidase family protein [Modicisalibacter tunisiensis]